jgi:hypothetical protein
MGIGNIHNDSEECSKEVSINNDNNRAGDTVEVQVNKTIPSAFKIHHNESQDEKDDIEESNSLKPSTTKDEPKSIKKSNKITPEDTKNKKKAIGKPKNYLTVSLKELKEDFKISNGRIKMTSLMRSKPVDIFIIVLILLYSLLVVVYLAISDEIEERPTVLLSLQITELVFLFIF